MGDGNGKKGKVCHLGMASSIHVQRWVNYFAERGWDIDLITFEGAEENELDTRIKQHVLKRPKIPWLGFIVASSRITKLIKRINPQIVHAHSVDGYGIFTAKIKDEMNSLPIIQTAWGFSHVRNHKGLKRYIEGKAISMADAVTTQDEGLQRTLSEAYNIPGSRFSIFHWGIDLDLFRKNYDDKVKTLREKIGISEGSQVIMSTREMHPYYNIASIILSIPQVLAKNPQSSFVFLQGQGKDRYAKKMEALADSLEVSNNVHFVNEKVCYEEIPIYLNLADIVIMLPYTDQASMSLIESLACGNIVVASDLKGNRDWIEDGMNGYLLHLNNPGVKNLQKIMYNEVFSDQERKIAINSIPPTILSTKINLVLSMIDRRGEITKLNRTLVEEKGDWKKGTSKMESIYMKLLSGKRHEND